MPSGLQRRPKTRSWSGPLLTRPPRAGLSSHSLHSNATVGLRPTRRRAGPGTQCQMRQRIGARPRGRTSRRQSNGSSGPEPGSAFCHIRCAYLGGHRSYPAKTEARMADLKLGESNAQRMLESLANATANPKSREGGKRLRILRARCDAAAFALSQSGCSSRAADSEPETARAAPSGGALSMTSCLRPGWTAGRSDCV